MGNLVTTTNLTPQKLLLVILEIFKVYFIENNNFGTNYGYSGNYNQHDPIKTYFQFPWKY